MDPKVEDDDDDDVELQADTPSVNTTVSATSPYRVSVQSRERTPDMAVQTFDGDFIYANGRQVQTRCCTRPIFNFAVMTGMLCTVLATCLVMLWVFGFSSPGADWLKTIIAFCIGVFVPSPQIPKKKQSYGPSTPVPV